MAMSAAPGKPREVPMLNRHRLAAASAVTLGAIGLALLVLMAFDDGRSIAQHVDDRVRDVMQSGQWAGWDVIARAFEVAGTWYVTWPFRIAVAVFLARGRKWEQLWAWCVAIALYEPMVGVLKRLYGRPRPPLAGDTTTFSFPSGHAVVGAAIGIGIVLVLLPAGRRRRRYEYLAGTFAFVMALSRVYLDAHWFTDVVAGTLIGAAVMIGTAAAVHEVVDRLHERRSLASREQAGASTRL